MSLTDIMSAAGMSSWTEVALILCFVTFVAVVAYLFFFRSKRSWDTQAMLPLNDGATAVDSREEVETS